MHYLKLRLLPTNKNGTCRVFLNQGLKNFHTLIWTVRGSGGGCQKSRQVNGVQVSCQHNCPVDQSICLHADMSVHRLVYLSTNINNKKHHLTSYIKKFHSKTRRLYPTVLLGCELK